MFTHMNFELNVYQKYMYAFRGWLAFVAFMDMGMAIRSFIERRCFLGEYSNTNANSLVENGDPTLPRIFGIFAILKALTLVHCTIFVHYKPVVSMGVCSLLLALIMYLLEALFYHSTTINFHVVFPCILNGLSILGLIILPGYLARASAVYDGDENEELLKNSIYLSTPGKIRRSRRNREKRS